MAQNLPATQHRPDSSEPSPGLHSWISPSPAPLPAAAATLLLFAAAARCSSQSKCLLLYSTAADSNANGPGMYTHCNVYSRPEVTSGYREYDSTTTVISIRGLKYAFNGSGADVTCRCICRSGCHRSVCRYPYLRCMRKAKCRNNQQMVHIRADAISSSIGSAIVRAKSLMNACHS